MNSIIQKRVQKIDTLAGIEGSFVDEIGKRLL